MAYELLSQSRKLKKQGALMRVWGEGMGWKIFLKNISGWRRGRRLLGTRE